MGLNKKAAASAGILFLLVAAGLIGSELALDSVNPDASSAGQWNGMDSSYTGAATRRSTRRSSSGTTRTVAVAPGVEQPTTIEIAPREESLTVHFGTFPQCNDRIKNGEETDVDCGGSQCPACDTGKTCSLDRDCKTSNCVNGVCGPELCEPGKTRCKLGSDGKQNGYIEFCIEARKGWQQGEKCANGCSDGSCVPACTDSDGGNDIFQKGSTTGATADNLLSSQTQTDICVSTDKLSEFNCVADDQGRELLTKSDVDCQNGCTNGACKQCVPNKGDSCNRNQCGGSGVVLCDGSCSAAAPNIPSNLGQPCNRNQCGGTGTVTCSGSCSAGAPSVPSNLGQPCNRNQCGGSGTIQCSGSCSAGAPSVPSNYGQACNRNACGGSGTITCSGSCSQSAPLCVYSCEDTDGGINGNRGGIVYVKRNGATLSTHKDTCVGSTLYEQYCSGQTRYQTTQACTYGCQDSTSGAYCKSAPTVTCSDSDGASGYGTYGYVRLYSNGQLTYTYTDTCSGSYVVENYCNGNQRATRNYYCTYGCSGGKCNPYTAPQPTTSYPTTTGGIKRCGYNVPGSSSYYTACPGSDQCIAKYGSGQPGCCVDYQAWVSNPNAPCKYY